MFPYLLNTKEGGNVPILSFFNYFGFICCKDVNEHPKISFLLSENVFKRNILLC